MALCFALKENNPECGIASHTIQIKGGCQIIEKFQGLPLEFHILLNNIANK